MTPLEEKMMRDAKLYMKIGEAIHSVRTGIGNQGYMVSQALQAFFGMMRDYGEMPAWFRNVKWDHQIEDVDPGRVQINVDSYATDGWQLVCAHPIMDDRQNVYTRLYFKRPQ